MAGKRKAPAKSAEATLEYNDEDGHYYLVEGKKKTDVGISKRYAERLLAEANG